MVKSTLRASSEDRRLFEARFERRRLRPPGYINRCQNRLEPDPY